MTSFYGSILLRTDITAESDHFTQPGFNLTRKRSRLCANTLLINTIINFSPNTI